MTQQFHIYISIQKLESRDLNRHLSTSVHRNIINNSQKVETIQVSISRWMDKQNAVHPYYGILFRHKKEQTFNTSHNMDETWKHERNQAQKDKYGYNSTYTRNLEKAS